MASIFSRIVAGEIPCYKVAENDKFFAFLDIAPLAKGHTLVIPKREVDYFYDLEDEELQGMIVFAKEIAKKIKATTQCTKVATVVLGLEVAWFPAVPVFPTAFISVFDLSCGLTP